MDLTTLGVAAILFAATYLQATTGFGLALVCVALMPLLVPVGDAIAYVSVAALVSTLFIMLANRGGLSFRNAGPLAIGMVLGIPVGYYTLHQLDGDLVVRLLGATLVVIAGAELLPARVRDRFLPSRFRSGGDIPEGLGGVFGFAGGVLAGAFNVGGPPLVVYAYSRNWSKVETVAILQTAFLAGGLTRNGLMIHSGEYSAELLVMVAWSVPGAALAVWLGKMTLDRLPRDLLRRIAFVLVLAIGLQYLLMG